MLCRNLRNGLLFVSLFGLGLLAEAPLAEARFAFPQLKQVPIERLIENLAAKVKESPKDASLRRNLARAHAMAYANKGADVRVGGFGPRAGDPWFGHTPKYIPFKVHPADGDEQEQQAKEQLAAAVAQYREVVKLSPGDAVTTLGLAWVLHQAGEADEAKKLYRETIKQAWKKEDELRRGRLGGNYLTLQLHKVCV